jgi:hypothetical protein
MLAAWTRSFLIGCFWMTWSHAVAPQVFACPLSLMCTFEVEAVELIPQIAGRISRRILRQSRAQGRVRERWLTWWLTGFDSYTRDTWLVPRRGGCLRWWDIRTIGTL